MYNKNQDKGFTLIELMIVVAIIGILAAIAVPTSYYFRQKAFEDTVQQDVHNAALAAEADFAETQAYRNFGPFTGGAGTTNFNISSTVPLKLSENVTIQAIVQADESVVITGTHPGATGPITYNSVVGAAP